ncbi:DUF3048 domain-containing protein [Bacillus alkalicellulosilyticus]|uniref:DUF3048 domain-containing protein n=1 Tax=Alkalihalobacterium alkalicellulosilyticum TaxID=1912214 RepID=UPI0009981525|nr:DUF3048 domain-containing protein [Bacillus alkalicellulosilyticus]
MKKGTKVLLAVSFSLLALVGCGKEEVQPEPVVEEPIIEETEPEPLFVTPLTGMGAEEELTSRPVAVIINNDPKARPQSGIDQADVVYEILAEGEITRFVAIFHSEQPERIGPVRSSREYHIDLANGYDSLFVIHGWSPEAKRLLEVENKADYLNGLFYDGTLFKRSTDRVAPHNSYISFEALQEGLTERGYELTGEVEPLAFAKDNSELGGDPAPLINVQYFNRNSVNFKYDEEQQIYLRYNGDQQTVDKDTGNPVILENVLIIETEHKVIDKQGRRDIDLTSGGKALLFQDGKAFELEWTNHNGRLLPSHNGNIVPFVPGKTWINVVPSLDENVEIVQ